jgi:hypothetical protein
MIQTNIYDDYIYFTLQFRDNSTNILQPVSKVLEPMNWDKILNRIPRDPSMYGFWSDFLEDKYGLTFTFASDEKGLNGGGQFLKDIYETYGDQAEVYFTLGANNQPIKSWRVNLEEYELLDGSDTSDYGGVQLSIEKMPFQGKLKSRLNTVCQINNVINIDGDLLTQIPVETLRLHSKTLLEETAFSSQNYQTSNNYGGDSYPNDGEPMAHDLIIQPDQSNSTIQELDSVFNQPMGFIDSFQDDGTSLNTPKAPTDTSTVNLINGEYLQNVNQFTPDYSGQLNIAWSGSSVIYTAGQLTTGVGRFIVNLCPRLVQFRQDGQGQWQLVQIVAGSINTLSNNNTELGPDINPFGSGANPSVFPFDINSASQQYILPSIEATLEPISALRSATSGFGIVTRYNGYNWNENFSVTVEAGDLIFVHIVGLQWNSTDFRTTISNKNILIQFDEFINTITYSQQTTAPATTSDGYRIFDIVNQLLENITGQQNSLKSSFFSEGGFGYKYLLTNGYAIRNFNAIINQPKTTLQSIINSLQAYFCLGIGIQEFVDEYGNFTEYLLVESVSDIFKTLEIERYTDTFGWIEKHNPDWCFNKVELGDNTWQGINYLMEDEFNTKANYEVQWRKYGDNILSKLSDIISSGYLIEEQRRNQFMLNSNQSWQNDEAMFIIATAEPCVFKAITITAINLLQYNTFSPFFSTIPTIYFTQIMALLTGDVVSFTYLSHTYSVVIASSVTGYPQIGADAYELNSQGDWVSVQAYLANQITFDVTGNALYIAINNITSSTRPGLDSANWLKWLFLTTQDVTITPPSPNQVFAERNNPFAICSGVIDPSTIYNGRLSRKHILYNWMPVIGIGLYFVDPSSQDYRVSQIVTTLARMNSKFTSQFLSSEPNKGNAGVFILNEFNREYIKQYLSAGGVLFTPVEFECNIKIGWNDVQVIRKALCGETGNPDIDFGGLTLKDSSGDFWFCHITDLSYDFVKQICTLKGQKALPIVS